MSHLSELKTVIDATGGPLRLRTYLSSVGPGPEVPKFAWTGPIERLEIAYRFSSLGDESKSFVYELEGVLQFWVYDVRGYVVHDHFETTRAKDIDGMARYCFLASSDESRDSMGLPGIYMSTYPDPLKDLPAGFKLVHPPWKSWRLTELATGKRWIGDAAHVMVDFAKSLAFPLAELAEVLVSPTAEPLAVQLLEPEPGGWNDDLTSPYDPAYNERLQKGPRREGGGALA